MSSSRGQQGGGSTTRPAIRRVDQVVRERVTEHLEPHGFEAEGSHWVRRTSGVIEVVEAQHSVYGARVTANLGLDLEWLRPLIRWVPRPQIGPHAHDCVRWIRVGLVEAEREDRWWRYEDDDEASIDKAAQDLADYVRGPGLGWIANEKTPAAFLRYAERQVERSRSQRQPDGGYLELRLLAAVHAWRGEFEEAGRICETAQAQWEEERGRLVMARKIYRSRHPAAPVRLPPVPNLQRELERLTAPTTGRRVLRRAGARPPEVLRPEPSGPAQEG